MVSGHRRPLPDLVISLMADGYNMTTTRGRRIPLVGNDSYASQHLQEMAYIHFDL
jgi:hypothetical protein